MNNLKITFVALLSLLSMVLLAQDPPNNSSESGFQRINLGNLAYQRTQAQFRYKPQS